MLPHSGLHGLGPMPRNHKTSGKVSRRSYLKRIGATGAVGGGLSLLQTSAVAEEDDTTVIITDKNRGEPVRTKEVPTEWYKQVQNAREGQDELTQRFSDEPWYVLSARRPDRNSEETDQIGGRPGYVLTLGVTDKAKVPDRNLPSEINGLPVIVEEQELPEPECQDDYDCVQGGANLQTVQNAGVSMTCIAEHNGDLGALTCAHWSPDSAEYCNTDISGEEITQSGDRVGDITDYGWSLDWAFAKEASDAEIDGLRDEILSHTYYVGGYVTRDGVDDMMATGEDAHQFGRSSCHTYGPLYDFPNVNHCGTGSTEFVRSSVHTEPGDSGGPHYRTLDAINAITIIGVHHGSDSLSYSYAGPAYSLNNNHGIEFGGDRTC